MTTKRTQRKSIPKLPPIVIVPDKSYVDDTDHLIVTDAIVIVAPESYRKLFEKMVGRQDVSEVRIEG